MTHSKPTPIDWASFFAQEDVAAALAESAEGAIQLMWAPLDQIAKRSAGEKKVLLETVAGIASYRLRPDDWNDPYPAAIQGLNGDHSPAPAGLADEVLALVMEAAPSIPHSGLRSRVFDVLSTRLAGKPKVDAAQQSIDTLLSAPITAATWYRDHEAWDRALLVARRLGPPTRSHVARIEASLRALVRGKSEGYEAFQAAELLAKHSLATDRAASIAKRLLQLAGIEDSDRRRTYLRGASDWYQRGGDGDQAAQLMAHVVRSYVAEAEAIAAIEANPFRAANLFEQALHTVRQLPKADRERLGIGKLAHTIARRIREVNARGLGSMSAFTSDPIDLGDAARQARDRVKDKSIDEALMSFAYLADWFQVDDEIRNTEELIAKHPFHTLFGNIQFAGDGRVVHRSSGAGGAKVYGVDPAVWHDVVRMYGWRIDLIVKGALWPAYVEITRVHHLSVAEFGLIVVGAGIIPKDRVHQVARALYYGFNGDFSTAMQLLAPQLENLVRVHMLNAGLNTTTIENGIENEIGLSALMDREEVETIFGRDFAFEIRLLFCGPLGPNLRNEIAHGLLSDGTASSSRAIYAWWIGIRLIFINFWNAMHDVEAAEAREPGRPADSDVEGDAASAPEGPADAPPGE